MIHKIAQFTSPIVRLLLLSTFALAASAQAETSTRQLSHLEPKAYDLDSRHSVLAVYQRVQTIAEHHCVANANLAAALTPAERACRDRVLNRLLDRLADPYLSYLHENPEARRLAKR